MKRILLAAVLVLAAAAALPAQIFTITVNSSGATNIVTTSAATLVTVFENASVPSAAFSITDPANGPGVTLNLPVGGRYTFMAKPGYPRGSTIGTVQAASGSGFTFVVIQRYVEVSFNVTQLLNPLMSSTTGGSGTALNVQSLAADPGTCTNAQIWYNTTSNTYKICPNGAATAIAAGGTMTSAAETVPSWLTVAGSPITTSGTFAITATTGQTSHQVIGTCGSATAFSPCALVAADIPTLNQNTTGSAASFTGSLAGDVTGTQGASVVAKVNGNSVPSGAAVHQVLDCTGASTCVWKTVPDCNGASNALNYTQGTDLFSCLSITTLSNPMTTLGDLLYGGPSGAATRLAGPTTPNGVPQTPTSTPAAGAATALAFALPGIAGRAVTGTTSTDTIVSTDCNPKRLEYVGSVAVAVTLPTATTLAVPSCVFKIDNATTGSATAVTVTPTTWTINGSATLIIAQGQQAWIYVDPNSATNWQADVNEGPLVAGTNITLTRSAQSGVTIASTGTGTQTVASGTSAMGTSAIASGACATVVTTTATGTATTDTFGWGFNADPTAVTGYAPTTNGMLTVIAWPTANNVNFKVCNNTSASITPGAVTFNFRVTR